MSDEPEYGLGMPFVACRSKGGPYDDDAYAAGFEAGMLYILLAAAGPDNMPHLIHRANREQVDLIAMRHGYVTSFEDAGDDWLSVTFTRGAGL